MHIMKHRWIATIGGAIVGLALIALAAEGPATFKVSEFTFTRPATWEWVEVKSPMRKAQLRVVNQESKQEAEVVFFHFGPSDGGSVQANIDRWYGQFSEPRDQIKAQSKEVQVSGQKITYVSAEGTYQSGMPGGPKTALSNHRLLGAIVQGTQGSVFIKLTCPKEFAAKLESDFHKMVEGVTK
jgi:hypothetical protein